LSHTVTIRAEVRDRQAVEAACLRLKIPAPVESTVTLFSNQVTGLAVALPDWHYPVVCDLPQGRLHYDNFDGRWGEPRELDRFLQAYVVEKARLEAHKQGHTVTERVLADQSIVLSIAVAGGA